MARTYKKKPKTLYTKEDVFEALRKVRDGAYLREKQAKTMQFYRRPLLELIKKPQETLTRDSIEAVYKRNGQVFCDEEEKLLTAYIKRATDIYFGLNPKEVRKLSNQYAVSLKKSTLQSWFKHEMAGEDWFSAFLQRNPSMLICTPNQQV
ncbi:hypothetical protein ILUMI_01442 [Ignelater luminosus]|uniref:HTH CENPB-type domain-containing protein n=1 Tax=Ignelater luminosus TaxID=2038154 RepID=A0A8K0DJP5_IGNLU|nr:hypothetical protein ILUMI_01442 [Ignelater luminosus]